ncbi:hypothetical protein MMC30_001778 [Trapelia coarctata]|nr:hypothetical protein [Trapelia coarctata]
MPPSPPAEAQHYRENVLTPESPRPLHIPEASNIPVLQNQIDPIFNLMSTHMEPPYASRNLTTMDHGMTHGAPAPSATEVDLASAPVDNGDDIDYDSKAEDLYGNTRSEERDAMSWDMDNIRSEQNQSNSSLNQNHASLLADQHSTSMASSDMLPTSTQATSEALASSTSFSKDSSQHLSKSYEPSQNTPNVNGHTMSWADYDTNEARMENEGSRDETVNHGGVNYQTLLDNISPSSTIVPTTQDPSIANSDVPTDKADTPTPANANLPSISAPALAGLPPRPPPQEKPAIHPNYTPGEDIRSYHFPHIHQTGNHTNHSSQPSSSYRPSPAYVPSSSASGPPPGAPITQSGLPPPPMATFQQQPARSGEQTQGNTHAQQNRQRDMISWTPEVQRIYDQFLSDERVYTAEGTWDKFPPGSRLFVGNLPSEVVTKRDIFQIFYRYGKLAQISIKQAYGFVQFLDPRACHAAMQGEQGMRIKDRNMHLEISKPQKNSRGAASTVAGDNLRASHYRRSRSPDHARRVQPHGVGPRPGADRFIPSNDFRNEPRRRDDYRPGRSPSPRGYRGRDDFRGGRDRSPERFYGGRRSRSRSPLGRAPRYRSPSPRAREIDEEAALPIPRREPRDVPDVQFILMDELDRAFVSYLEKYDELDVHVAVELVVRAKATQSATTPTQSQFPGPAQPYAALQYPQSLNQTLPPQQAAPPTTQPNLTSLITSLDGPALQKLLGAMQQTPQTPTATQQNMQQGQPHNPNLSALLGNVGMQQPQPNQVHAQQGYPYPQNLLLHPPQQQAQAQQPYSYGAPYQPPVAQPVPPQHLQHQQIQDGQHQVQNIMEQLAKWNR